MSGKQKDSEDFHVSINLPQDGSYPPRIVTPNHTIWTDLKKSPVVLAEGISVQSEENRYKLFATSELDIYVNGKHLVGRYTLKDEDYISSKKFRGIFQSDPTRDYRLDWATDNKSEKKIILKPSKQIAQHVKIDNSGISFDGGKTITSWYEVEHIYFYWEHMTDNWSIQVHTENRYASSNFKRSKLSTAEMFTVLNWLLYSSPYHPSINHFSKKTFPDAFEYLVFNKIILPAQAGKRELPAPIGEILGLYTLRQTIIHILYSLIFCIGSSVLVALLFHFSEGISLKSFWILLVMFLILFTPALWRDIQHLRNLPKFDSNYQIWYGIDNIDIL